MKPKISYEAQKNTSRLQEFGDVSGSDELDTERSECCNARLTQIGADDFICYKCGHLINKKGCCGSNQNKP